MTLTLLGVLVIVLGFAARLNPLLVVTAAAIVTGLAGGLDFIEVISAFGRAFNENRYVSVTFIVLPVIGALERAGLQERAKSFILSLEAMTAFDQRIGLVPGQVEQLRGAHAPDLQHVAKTLGGQKPGGGALAFEQRVGADGGAVQHLVDILGCYSRHGEDAPDAIDHRGFGFGRGR